MAHRAPAVVIAGCGGRTRPDAVVARADAAATLVEAAATRTRAAAAMAEVNDMLATAAQQGSKH